MVACDRQARHHSGSGASTSSANYPARRRTSRLTARLRTVRTPAHLAGMRIRLLPSNMPCRIFERPGAVPVPCDLKPALDAIASGNVDAQENPPANSVTYGVHKLHRYHTLTGHCYLSRGIYVNRAAFDGWPEPFRATMRAAAREAILSQRQLAVEEESIARTAIEGEGCEIVALTAGERDRFARGVGPLYDEARKRFGPGIFALVEDA